VLVFLDFLALSRLNGSVPAGISGADFICVGTFDFQVEENAKLAKSVIHRTQNRERTWMA
jgi:hypothetical protein